MADDMTVAGGNGGTIDPDGRIVTVTGGTVGIIGDHGYIGTMNVVTPRREVVWPVSVGSPPPRATAFQPRTHVEERIRDAAGTVMLSGDGGTGKSQIAADLYLSSDTDLRVWVSAESRTAVITGYADAATRLDLADPGTDPEHLAALFLRFLETTKQTWLVVLDDLADPADLDKLWPTGTRAVATTRRKDATLSGGGRSMIDVGVFSPHEAVDYLTQRITDLTTGLAESDLPPNVLEHAADLTADLGYLPLALAQAAAVIIDQAITCAQFRHWYADRRQHLDDLFSGITDTDGYNRTIATTWTLAIDAADRLTPTGLARPLAALAATGDPAGAPEALYTSTAACHYLTGQTGHEVTAVDARKALRNLARLSLITHNPDTSNPRSVRMHNLTARAILETHTPDTLTHLVQTVADALVEIWPQVENNPTHSETLRANTTTLNALEPDSLWNTTTGAHPALFRAGRSITDAGLARPAIDYFNTLHIQAESRLGPDHPDTLTAQNNLARAYTSAGDLARAIPLFEQTLTDMTRVLGPGHPDTLTAQNNLAGAYERAGNLAQAIPLYEQNLTDRTKLLGPGHPDTLTARNNLACACWAAGILTRAIALFDQNLTDSIRILGPDHPDTLLSLNNLAGAYESAGRPARAIPLYEQSLSDISRVLGRDHPSTLSVQNNLAGAYQSAGNLASAIPLFEKTLTDRTRILGPDHPDTLLSQSNIAYAYQAAGSLAQAIPVFEQTVTDRTKVLGRDHPDTLLSQHILAGAYESAGELERAILLYEQNLADLTRVLGPDHPSRLVAQNNLAGAYASTGALARAIPLFEQTLTDTTRILGPDHPHRLTTQNNLAGAYERAGNLARAIPLYEKTLSDMTRVLGPDHPNTLTAQSNLAHAHQTARDQGLIPKPEE